MSPLYSPARARLRFSYSTDPKDRVEPKPIIERYPAFSPPFIKRINHQAFWSAQRGIREYEGDPVHYSNGFSGLGTLKRPHTCAVSSSNGKIESAYDCVPRRSQRSKKSACFT